MSSAQPARSPAPESTGPALPGTASLPLVWVPHKGRGSSWALPHRFSRDTREQVDDGWGTLAQQAECEALSPATHIIEEQARSILTGNDSPDINFDLSINPYRGCEHVMRR